MASAVSSNILFVVLAVVALGVWGAWVRARIVDRPLFAWRLPVWSIAVGVAIVSTFTVLRNIPAGSWLAP